MHTPFIIFYLAIVLAVGAGRVGADMVILKSGEMFQTPRAWKENGAVNYFKDGRVVRVDEDQVDRLIHSPAPAEEKPMPEHLPESDRSLPLENPVAGRARLPADGDAGYLGLRWGQPLSRVEGLTHTGTDPAYGGVQLFSHQQHRHRFGRARVDDIVYGFWQGGLYTITVWTSNFMDFRDLKAEAFRRFGEGIQNQDGVEKYHWMDTVTDRMLSYDYDSDTGYLWMRSRVLHEKVRARYPE
jgi:hypothetical protein